MKDKRWVQWMLLSVMLILSLLLLKPGLAHASPMINLPSPMRALLEEPFSYVVDDQGTYPEHGTSNYTNTDQNEDIKNYDYGKSKQEGNSQVTNVLDNGSLQFENGYHGYSEGYLKKTVSPTDDPTKFKIQLDAIGKGLPTDVPVDIAMVIDRSSSMTDSWGGKTRWKVLQEAVAKFTTDLLNTNTNDQIRIGLAGFGSERRGVLRPQRRPYVDIGKFTGGSAFTSDPNKILTHELYATNPKSPSGTPTYLGFDAGYLMLNEQSGYGARPNAIKILIFFSDGEPTYSNGDGYNDEANGLAEIAKDSNAVRDRYEALGNLHSGSGEGKKTKDTIDYVKKRYSHVDTQNVSKYSLGITGETVDGDGAQELLDLLGKDGSFLANEADSLSGLLQQIYDRLNITIKDAKITDPMSEYVTKTSTITSSALDVDKSGIKVIPSTSATYPQYAKDISISDAGDTIVLENVNLGRVNGVMQGYRIEYEVTLKKEYQDGKFYPTNKLTFLENHYAPNGSNLYFAVPSVRLSSKTIDIQVEKKWEDDENKWKTREPIQLILQKKIGSGTWQDVEGKVVDFSPGDTDLTHLFTELPVLENQEVIEYRIVEKVGDKQRVYGYEAPVYTPSTTSGESLTPLVVTNTLQKTKLMFTKVSTDENTPLSDVEFTLYRKPDLTTPISQVVTGDDGLVIFDGLPVGEYVIKETKTPAGYEPISDIEISVKQTDEGKLEITGMPEDNKIVNRLYPFRLSFKKVGMDHNGLSGAEFTLTGPGITGELVSQSEETGLVTFDHDLIPGEYELTETKAPNGYEIHPASPWKIIISENQEVTITDSQGIIIYQETVPLDVDKHQFDLVMPDVENHLKDFTLTVAKKDDYGIALDGASFRLTNEEGYDVTISQDSDSQFVFTELKPGMYQLTEVQAPDGYIILEKPISIIISLDGSVTIDGTVQEGVLTENGNHISIDVENKPKGVLPETGGPGQWLFYVLGISLTGISVLYLLRRKTTNREVV